MDTRTGILFPSLLLVTLRQTAVVGVGTMLAGAISSLKMFPRDAMPVLPVSATVTDRYIRTRICCYPGFNGFNVIA